jgi:hypothetical protein
VQDAGRPVELDDDVVVVLVVLLDGAGQAGEPIAGWLLAAFGQLLLPGWKKQGVACTYMRAAIPAKTSDEYIILRVDVSRIPGE